MKKKTISILLLLVMVITTLVIPSEPTYAAVKISKRQATMEIDSTLVLKVIGTKDTVKWKSEEKSIASVSKKGKVTAKSEGIAHIVAIVGEKRYVCYIYVVDTEKHGAPAFVSEQDPTSEPTPTPTPTPIPKSEPSIEVDTSSFDGLLGDGFMFSAKTTSGLTHLSRVKFTKVDYTYTYSEYSQDFNITIDYAAQSADEIETHHLSSSVTYKFNYKVYDSEGYVIESGSFWLPQMYVGGKVKGSFTIYDIKANFGEKIKVSISDDYVY